MGRLDDLDLTKKLKRREQDERLAAGGRRLAQLRLALGGRLEEGGPLGPPLILVFEGWDASGKGGAINRLVAPIDARHVRVAAYSAPTADEKRHHYLRRFWTALPGRGGMTVFDRSWYGRVLVERVEGFAHEEEWRRAYGEIVEFERQLVADGAIIVKFWLHISPEEQLHRFQRRSWRIRLSAGRSPPTTGATARSVRSTPRRSRRCSRGPTSPRRPGSSSRASQSASRA
jgi:polyphosphate kinase 2 (PPK2 family)